MQNHMRHCRVEVRACSHIVFSTSGPPCFELPPMQLVVLYGPVLLVAVAEWHAAGVSEEEVMKEPAPAAAPAAPPEPSTSAAEVDMWSSQPSVVDPEADPWSDPWTDAGSAPPVVPPSTLQPPLPSETAATEEDLWEPQLAFDDDAEVPSPAAPPPPLRPPASKKQGASLLTAAMLFCPCYNDAER